MKSRREWSADLEERWYMANRRLRAWEWAAKMGVVPLNKDYKEFKQNLEKIRANSDLKSFTALQFGMGNIVHFGGTPESTLTWLTDSADQLLRWRIIEYLEKNKRIKAGVVGEKVENLLNELKKPEIDSVIILYLANYLDKLARSEKKNPQLASSLESIKDDVKVMIRKFQDKNYEGSLIDLRMIISQIELSGFSRADTAVTLAAMMHDLEIPPDMFEKLNAEALKKGLINQKDEHLLLYLLDLREGIKYARFVKEYFKTGDIENPKSAQDELDIAGIEALLTGKYSSGQELQHLSPEKIISEILPSLEKPVDKLKFILDEIELRYDSLANDPRNFTVFKDEIQRIVKEYPDDQEVKDLLRISLEDKKSYLNRIFSPLSPEVDLKSEGKLTGDYSSGHQRNIAQLFKESGGRDPFRVMGPIDFFAKLVSNPNSKVKKIPLDEIATYMIAHPEHAEFFVKPPSRVLAGRNFRKELLGSSAIVDRMIAEGGEDLHQVLIKNSITTEDNIRKYKANVAQSKEEVVNPTVQMGSQGESGLESKARPEETVETKASRLINEIEVLVKNENIESGRRREVSAQISFFKNVIKKPGHSENLISALKGIKKILKDETAKKTADSNRFFRDDIRIETAISSRDLIGRGIDLDTITRISEMLEQGTTLEKDRVKEIQHVLSLSVNLLKEGQPIDEGHSKLLSSIENEVSEAKLPSSGMGKR